MAQKRRAKKRSYPSDVSDEEWAFCAPYLTLMKEEARQREYPLRAMFNAVRYMVRAGCPWRMIPHDLPPWSSVHQQAQRWIKAGCFEAMGHDLRKVFASFGREARRAFRSHHRRAHPALYPREWEPRRLRWA
jgi:transposase